MRDFSRGQTPLLSLFAGAAGIACAPLFVRWSEVGPCATAFYRVFIALPFLLVGQTLSATHGSRTDPAASRWTLVLAGLFFAGDLALWHASIGRTSVANATLLVNLAPLFVTLGARVLLRERIRPGFRAGLALSMGGTVLVVGNSLQLTRQHVVGDLLGVATAVFYAGYLLSVKHARRSHSTVRVMIGSGLSACPVLLLLAALLSEPLAPVTAGGWGSLVSLALVSQIAGQGLITFALAHLPASFASVALLTQPVIAALLAWLILSEPLHPVQALGGIAVLAGIAVAGRARSESEGSHPRF